MMADVSNEIDPANPIVQVVSIGYSNFKSMFVKDGRFIIDNKIDISEVMLDRKFIGEGTFVVWEGVDLDQIFNDGDQGAILNQNQAIENFIIQFDFLASCSVKLKTHTHDCH